MWATHSVHHSAGQMTLLASIRLGWTNLFSAGWVCYAPLVFAGFDPRMIAVLLAVNLRYQFFLHTEAVGRLGPLEWVFNTPSHHRVHHGTNPCYLDRNYGGVLIVFDRLFGSFAAERPDEPVRYGLAHRAPSHNPLKIAFGEWAALLRRAWTAPTARARAIALFGPPA
jgi:sterol desaturase/sphingolipid hydroxylase (fatty acid hydroxylase superfamily)